MMRTVVRVPFPVSRTACGPGNDTFTVIMKREGQGMTRFSPLRGRGGQGMRRSEELAFRSLEEMSCPGWGTRREGPKTGLERQGMPLGVWGMRLAVGSLTTESKHPGGARGGSPRFMSVVAALRAAASAPRARPAWSDGGRSRLRGLAAGLLPVRSR
jgi:hypothetical protein